MENNLRFGRYLQYCQIAKSYNYRKYSKNRMLCFRTTNNVKNYYDNQYFLCGNEKFAKLVDYRRFWNRAKLNYV